MARKINVLFDHRATGYWTVGVSSNADLASLELLNRAFDPSRLVDLTHTLAEGIPSFATHPKFSRTGWPSHDDPAELNQLVLSDHSGTHVDAPAHFVPGADDPRRVRSKASRSTRSSARQYGSASAPLSRLGILASRDPTR